MESFSYHVAYIFMCYMKSLSLFLGDPFQMDV